MAMIDAGTTGKPSLDAKSQNIKAANTYMPAAAIWKIRVVLYTKANPIANTEYKIPVMSPLMTNCPIINSLIVLICKYNKILNMASELICFFDYKDINVFFIETS